MSKLLETAARISRGQNRLFVLRMPEMREGECEEEVPAFSNAQLSILNSWTVSIVLISRRLSGQQRTSCNDTI